MMLQGHSQEVTSMAWCPTDFTKIASCSDDNTVRIWRLDRGSDGMRSSVGEANLVGWARPKTPSKTSSPGQPLGAAACAPSGADLPLPSSTLSTPPPVGATRRPSPTPRGTPPSIRHWLARTPGSPDLQATPPQRKALSARPQSPALTPPTPSERRAKRRLETGEGGASGCEGAGPCGCVTELYPAPKRRRGLGVCCPAPDSDGRSPEGEEGEGGRGGGAEACHL
ncbi:hypothetical protein AAFF_G00088400 [Aldrovandia affinis]|uniref:Uncharacterized protein n=1 Tax=Aldrovandia affinis TaxID=143900 RepID=A0AAD7RWM7_9TELE|nr:hypothetical protein AAFF_G00088400 [Aldrovandia affinis]